MKKMKGIVALLLAVLMLFSTACTPATPDESTAATTPVVTPDVSTPDASPDASTPNATPDASTPNATPDASTPGATPDASTPNVTPDASTPNATPDASTPNVTPPASTPGEDVPTVPMAEQYNIVFALATIPPVLSALESIRSGYPTYVIIERGKTYSGIAQLENFYNVGFDPDNNLSQGFTTTEFNAMVEQVKAILAANPDAFFNFYVQDGTALKGAAIAANAGVAADKFHVYMCEDGTGAYTALNRTYVDGKTVNADKDDVYDNYLAKVEAAKAEFEAVMAKTDNKNTDAVLGYNIGKAYALAGLDNFTYYIQDENLVIDILENTGDVKTKLLAAFGVDGYTADVEVTLNLKYGKISEAVAQLTEEQRTDYLTLMYGDFYADTYAALTRTERADKTAPTKKLVFIGSRHSGYPGFASKDAYGIGGLAADATLPATYAELDAKYKNEFLFATEADYQLFLDELAKADNFAADITAEVKNKAAVACFNNYINYIFTLKLTYALYGEDYDIIMKGHPREVIGSWGEWGNRYKVTYKVGEEEKSYVYDKFYDNVLLSFHAKDSVGKYIGMVPYGTAAENLAYLGADIAIAGLPSSTYSGFDTAVDVLFILCETDEDIIGTGKDTAASQVKERYEAGNLLYTDGEGNEKAAVFYNIGNTYKALADICEANGNDTLAAAYTAKYNAWLDTVHPTADDINEQGFPVNNG